MISYWSVLLAFHFLNPSCNMFIFFLFWSRSLPLSESDLTHFTCTSDNVICCISCRKYPRTVYIGETGRRLADRFREQRHDVLHKKSDLPVAQHFNSPGHSLEDVRIAVGQRRRMSANARRWDKFSNSKHSLLGDKSRFLIYMKSRDTRAHFFARANSSKAAHNCK